MRFFKATTILAILIFILCCHRLSTNKLNFVKESTLCFLALRSHKFSTGQKLNTSDLFFIIYTLKISKIYYKFQKRRHRFENGTLLKLQLKINGIKINEIPAEKNDRRGQSVSKSLAEKSEYLWSLTSVYTKVSEFTLDVNMASVSVIMFTFQCAVNNGFRKLHICITVLCATAGTAEQLRDWEGGGGQH